MNLTRNDVTSCLSDVVVDVAAQMNSKTGRWKKLRFMPMADTFLLETFPTGADTFFSWDEMDEAVQAFNDFIV